MIKRLASLYKLLNEHFLKVSTIGKLYIYILSLQRYTSRAGIINDWFLSIPQEKALCDRLVCPSVRLSVCPPVFTITQEWIDVEWWNFVHVYFGPRVTLNSKMGHVQDLWPGQIEDFHTGALRLHSVHIHVSIPVEYLYICMCYSNLFS